MGMEMESRGWGGDGTISRQRAAVYSSEVVSEWLVFLGELAQGVPLCDGSARVGQHVAPVLQLRAGGSAAYSHVTDRLRRPDTVVVYDRHVQRHLLYTAAHGSGTH